MRGQQRARLHDALVPQLQVRQRPRHALVRDDRHHNALWPHQEALQDLGQQAVEELLNALAHHLADHRAGVDVVAELGRLGERDEDGPERRDFGHEWLEVDAERCDGADVVHFRLQRCPAHNGVGVRAVSK